MSHGAWNKANKCQLCCATKSTKMQGKGTPNPIQMNEFIGLVLMTFCVSTKSWSIFLIFLNFIKSNKSISKVRKFFEITNYVIPN